MLKVSRIVINSTRNKVLRIFICGFGAVSTEEEIMRDIAPHLLGPIAVDNLIFYWNNIGDLINIVEL